MSEIKELEERIRNLPHHDLAKFRDWFYALKNELWDEQIKSDFKSGKFDKFIIRARSEFSEGKARELWSMICGRFALENIIEQSELMHQAEFNGFGLEAIPIMINLLVIDG